MNFNNETALLCDIYRGADMGCDAIALMLPKVRNPEFRSDLKTQYQKYQEIQDQAEQQLKEQGTCPEESSRFSKAALAAGIHWKTAVNQETSHFADMIIAGSNMGITQLTKTLNHYKDGVPQVRELAQTLIRTEQDNIERMKPYLS